jgi:hypothetical protein
MRTPVESFERLGGRGSALVFNEKQPAAARGEVADYLVR